MTSIIFNGLKFGIVLAILVGPVFFTIIQTSVERGFWKGALVAFGVSLSDIVTVVICWFGVIQFLNEPKFRVDMSYIGGVILIGFGIYYLIVKGKKKVQVASANEKGFFRYIVKGFLINGLTPSVILFWVASSSLATTVFGYNTAEKFFLFFGTVLFTCLSTDVLKAYLANKLGGVMTPRVIMIMNILVGIGMILFGGRLIFLAPTLAHSHA
jgi:threonine/homoserine/homoserine lactone efflux protein